MMKTIITEKLQHIERMHDIKILYACESGSRAWGFPSPDSDYDVRFIYARPLESYLSIKDVKNHMNFPLTDELDINGWDIRKTLQLISQSNTTAFEWLQSPIVYHQKEGFKDEAWKVCQKYFCRRSNIHHYLGIAKGAMMSMNNDELKIKKLFYVLRPLLAALWCVEKNKISPMYIFPLLELMPEAVKNKVLSLIERKSKAEERFIIKPEPKIREWIDQTFDYCSKASEKYEKLYFEKDYADTLFRKIVTEK